MRLWGVSKNCAIGALQQLWWSVDECKTIKPDGRLVNWSDTHIADACNLDSDPKKIVDALEKSGFLLRQEDGVYAIHDYWEWCPDYVMKRWFEANIIKDRFRKTASEACKRGLVMTSHDLSCTSACTPIAYTQPNVTQRNLTKPNTILMPEAANAAPARKAKPRSEKQIERDSLFDAIKVAFYPSGTSKADEKLIGQTVTALKAKKASPEEVSRRLSLWPSLYPDAAPLSPPGLAKHWDALNGRSGVRTPKPRRNEGIENEKDDHVYLRALKKWQQENGQ